MRSAHWALICLAIVMLVVTRVPAPPSARGASPAFIGALQSSNPAANLDASALS
jgi:hypothetical protein